MLNTLRRNVILCALLAILVPAAATHAAAPDWGVNLWFHSYWSSDGAFVNAAKTFRHFHDYGDRRLTGQGIPLTTATTYSMMRGYPAGIYRLRYKGIGNVSFSGLGHIVSGSLYRRNGYTYAKVKLEEPTAKRMLYMTVSGVSATNPVRDLRLIAPGYNADTRHEYRAEFLARVKPFSTLRFMDWTRTNDSQTRGWQDQRPANWFTETIAPNNKGGAVSWQAIIRLTNDANKDAWINIPHKASNAYIERLAKLWKNGLEPGRRLIVEFSNEVWNPEFRQYHDLTKLSRNGNAYYDGVAPRLYRTRKIFDQVWGNQRGRVEVVLAGQAGNSWQAKQTLRWFTDRKIPPRSIISAIAIAPYLKPRGVDKNASVNAIFAGLNDLSFERTAIREHRAMAKQYGLKLYGYEGGLDLYAFDPAKRRQVEQDPRVRTVYRKFSQLWQSEGGALFVHYAFTSAENNWGLLGDLRERGSMKWDAVMSILLKGGDANLDGVVDQRDSDRVRRFYGKTGWWEQGDFNGDRKVDSRDQRILATGLGGR